MAPGIPTSPETQAPPVKDAENMCVLFENEEVLAVDKPAGIAVIPERRETTPCLLHALEKERGERLFVVHRLDKEVSGILLFARTASMHRHLSLEFENRRVKKTYQALVHGRIREKKGSVDAPIRLFGSGRMGVDREGGKPSLTHWEMELSGENLSLIRVFPVTGRRHQIRVHLYHMGHPIVGDLRYGEKESQKGWPRLMLHAHQLECGLPCGRLLRLESSVPHLFHTFLR